MDGLYQQTPVDAGQERPTRGNSQKLQVQGGMTVT
jgi:hypothetical protein